MKPYRPLGFISSKHQLAMELEVYYLIALASSPFMRTLNCYPFYIFIDHVQKFHTLPLLNHHSWPPHTSFHVLINKQRQNKCWQLDNNNLFELINVNEFKVNRFDPLFTKQG